MAKRRLFTARDVSSFRVFPERVIGRGGQGPIVLGSIKFKGQKGRHGKIVAVREFKRPQEWKPKDFNRMVERLERAGVRIPKTRVIEHNGKFYQVMESFKAGKKSKFLGNVEGYRRFSSLSMKDKPLIKAIALDYARVFNAGYVAPDIDLENYLFVENGKRETYYFIDLHNIRKLKMKYIAIDLFRFYQGLFVIEYSKMKDPEARKLFMETFGENLRPGIRRRWKTVVESGTTKLNEFLRKQKR